VLFRRCHDCTLQGLQIQGVERQEAGLELDACRRFHVSGCTILDCDNCGLLLKDVTQSRVADCLIRDDREGAKSARVKLVGGSDNQISPDLIGG
jgi:hypothetical protein